MSYYFPSINTNFFRAGCSLFAKLTALFISFYWEGRICAIKFDYHLNSRGRASLNFSATYQAEDSTALNVTYVIFYIGYLNFFSPWNKSNFNSPLNFIHSLPLFNYCFQMLVDVDKERCRHCTSTFFVLSWLLNSFTDAHTPTSHTYTKSLLLVLMFSLPLQLCTHVISC